MHCYILPHLVRVEKSRVGVYACQGLVHCLDIEILSDGESYLAIILIGDIVSKKFIDLV